ncbi:NAD(P)-binding protein [Rhizodiscina lignyota]|uniref:NAD(P)-binding protein n=1 Tax=Rhizodiscina lignyota TaxID=1504668 RepID=A0A9P4I6L1_9PEZI|nr:NAD(P)-binding protein [Rhizodiscina lignyota]
MSPLKSILVIGATGAQGMAVVRSLSRSRRYAVRAMTRSDSSADAKLISSWPNVSLFIGDCFNEADLRKAFSGVHGAFVNTNGYVTGEKGEIYWGIRMYEIAVRAGVKHWVWGSLDYSTKLGGWHERFKCGHYDGKGKVADWVLAQPRSPMASSVLTSGPYMELLFEFMLPRPPKAPGEPYVFVAPLGSGAVPLIHLEDLGEYGLYLFDNPSTNGLDLKVATQHVHWAELASTFTKVTGKPAEYLDVSLEEYMDKYYPAGKKAVTRKIGTDRKDPTLLTWGQNFSGFWNLFKESGGNKGLVRRDYEMLDRIHPGRVKSVGEWMKKVGYEGQPRPVLKDWVDGGIAKGERVEARL